MAFAIVYCPRHIAIVYCSRHIASCRLINHAWLGTLHLLSDLESTQHLYHSCLERLRSCSQCPHPYQIHHGCLCRYSSPQCSNSGNPRAGHTPFAPTTTEIPYISLPTSLIFVYFGTTWRTKFWTECPERFSTDIGEIHRPSKHNYWRWKPGTSEMAMFDHSVVPEDNVWTSHTTSCEKWWN
jgi:hypothetical protein